MLEVIGAGNPDYKGQDWGDVWANSVESKKLTEELENIISSRREMQDDEKIKDDREYAMPLYTQIVAVTRRAFVAYWRLPDYILVWHLLFFPYMWRSFSLMLCSRAKCCFTFLPAFSIRSHSGILGTATLTCSRDSFPSS